MTEMPSSIEPPVIDTALVRRLVSGQFPQWANLRVRPVAHGGWDNRTFHLGEQMTVRLPSSADYSMQVDKEQRWLPRLAPMLPLPIPAPLAMGKPADGYPFRWSIYRWIDGDTAVPERIADLRDFAANLARFLVALQRIDPTDGPAPGPHNFYRAGPLTVYDTETRRAIVALKGRIDVAVVMQVWEAALASLWQGPPVWVHGDVGVDNLLVQRGRLCAVIDFGSIAVGDPACDLAIAWTLFEGASRDIFRELLALDAATWSRARGWTLWKALIVATGLTNANAAEAAQAWRIIDKLLVDPDGD